MSWRGASRRRQRWHCPPRSRCASPRLSEAERWAHTATQGFLGRDDVPADHPLFQLSLVAFHRPDVQAWWAWQDNEPVAVGGLGLDGGVATLFSMSTRAGFRGRGIQAALIAARLGAAAAAGCDLATVMTTPGTVSQRNVERAGFQIMYTKTTLARSNQ